MKQQAEVTEGDDGWDKLLQRRIAAAPQCRSVRVSREEPSEAWISAKNADRRGLATCAAAAAVAIIVVAYRGPPLFNHLEAPSNHPTFATAQSAYEGRGATSMRRAL